MKALVIHEPFASQILAKSKVWEVRSWRIRPGEYLVVSNQEAVCVIEISARLRVDPDGEIYLEEGNENLIPDDFESNVWAGDVPLFFHLITNVKPPPDALKDRRIKGRLKIFNVDV